MKKYFLLILVCGTTEKSICANRPQIQPARLCPTLLQSTKETLKTSHLNYRALTKAFIVGACTAYAGYTLHDVYYNPDDTIAEYTGYPNYITASACAILGCVNILLTDLGTMSYRRYSNRRNKEFEIWKKSQENK